MQTQAASSFLTRAPSPRLAPFASTLCGERSGVIRDPFGHRWNIGHSIEELAPEEMQRRYTALMNGQ